MKPSSQMTRDEGRAFAREDTAKALMDHERQKGRDMSFESAQRIVNERADVLDKKKDWGVKE